MMLANRYRGREETERYISLRKTAADNGMVPAMCQLAGLYMKGKKIRRDPEEAQKYINMALATGSPSARYYLGCVYAFGRSGFPKELEKGRVYLEEAVAAGNTKAQKALAKLNRK